MSNESMLKNEVAAALWDHAPATGKRIVEVGTGLGESAAFFSAMWPDWTIYTIDAFGLYGDGRVYDRFDHDKVLAINKSLGSNVIQVLGDSSKVPWELAIDILFLDGDHTFDGVGKDFIRYAPHVRRGGIICFDDYNQPANPTNGVKKFIEQLESSIKIDDPDLGDPDFQFLYRGYYCCIIQKL